MSRVRVSPVEVCELEHFEFVTTAPGRFSVPAQVDFTDALSVRRPATVAAALSLHKRLDLAAPPDLDGSDHWFRARLPESLPSAPHTLVFEGLATLCDVWLDGQHVLTSESMFARHEIALEHDVRAGSELTLRFRALTPFLAQRRPRPRWRTRIVDAQQLRWVRTSLIGRTPGFCPRVPVVGPYRPMRLISRAKLSVGEARVAVSLTGTTGRVQVSLALTCPNAALAGELRTAQLIVAGAAGEGRTALTLELDGLSIRFYGELSIENVARWWPHTHGAQPLSALSIEVAQSDGNTLAFELGSVGFRELRVERDSDGHGFGIVINGVPVFARGACWTTDALLTPGESDPYPTLRLVRAAGMNMLRIGGTTSYESPAFFDACDALGIMVFQDFMFANMDYPASDAGFVAQVEREARELLAQIGARPCLTVLCGSSEIEQQVAMLGMPRELWTSTLASELLPRVSDELAPGVPYISSSPTGGDLPFQADRGVSHYYGVGAYHRPLEDARRANVRFAAECLAFANPPCRETIDGFMRDLEMPYHHPRWKERVPRDRGVGWDFEDTRDHYLQRLFELDPRELRYTDPERYLALGMAAVGEAMTATYAEFRRVGSSCRGALVFWLKDFWDGAGWGVIDASGRPKSAYYYLKRVLAPVTVQCTDEGLNGIFLHVTNDRDRPLDAVVEIELFRAGDVHLAGVHAPARVLAHSTALLRVEGLLERFSDSAYAYRFGPPSHDLLVASLRVGDEMMAQSFHQPDSRARALELDVGLTAQVEQRDGRAGLRVSTRRFAQAVTLDVPGYRPEDDWFHLAPHSERFIALSPTSSAGGPIRGGVSALNSLARATIVSESK